MLGLGVLVGMSVFSNYWYVVWGTFTGGALAAAYLYVRSNPGSQFASYWERIRYAAAASVAISMILILVGAAVEVIVPRYSSISFLFSPYFGLALFAGCWIAAPLLKRVLPR